jgi:transposase
LIRHWLAKRPRFRVHFTPTYGSWLNLVERWFAELTNKQLRRGVHRSVPQLKAAIREFIAATIARFAQRTLDFHTGHLLREPRGQDTSGLY